MIDRLGPYEVLRELGRGGMGVVYLARDTRLNREVAIKALPVEMASDPARLERFEREAKTLASLNHPNLAGIHGVEEQDGAKYLVLEFVEGESLADMLDRGPIPVDEAIELAVQIAAGVEAAHEAGVIHRDLKPANIIVTPEGKAKVLDFGLARMDTGMSSSSHGPDSPTVVTLEPQHSPTIEGTILGTAAYMSPEQARGRRIDKRTDIWSFGVVLYEMLVGASPFHGETASDSIGAVLHKNLDLDRLPPETPANVRRVLDRCLVRDRNLRFRDIGDVRIELERAGEHQSVVATARHGVPIAWLAAAIVLAVAGTGAAWFLKPTPPIEPAPPVRLSIPLPEGMEIAGPIAISPNGEIIAFTAGDAFGVVRLYTRRLDGYEINEIKNSIGAYAPFFSPDSASIGFASRGYLVRVPAEGGQAIRLIDTTEDFGGANWGEDDTILYSEGLGSAIKRVGADGRRYDEVTALVPGDGVYAHVWPQHIPGTRKVLFTAWTDSSTEGEDGGRILDLDNGEHRRVGFGSSGFGWPSRWVASGHLIFERFWSNELLVIAMDPYADEPVAQASAKTFLTGVQGIEGATRQLFDVSNDGTMAYVPVDEDGNRLVWVDAMGDTETVLDQSDIDYMNLRRQVMISPDGTRALLGGGGEITVLDLETGQSRRVTNSDGNKLAEAWSPDGSRIFFVSNKDTRWSIWSVGLEPNAAEEMVYQGEGDMFGVSVTPNGTLVTAIQVDGQYDLLVINPDGTTRPLTRTPETEYRPELSPDGRWVAYEREVVGIDEVFVVDLAGERSPVQISRGGGDSPKWSRDGASLSFRRARSVVQIGFADGRAVGEPTAVFSAPRLDTGIGYDFSPDGSRMLAIQEDEGAVLDEIRVMTNLFDTLREVAGPGSRQEPN
jgi:Tol biopolymer transport system component/predicted Ser/Thr protein kinase